MSLMWYIGENKGSFYMGIGLIQLVRKAYREKLNPIERNMFEMWRIKDRNLVSWKLPFSLNSVQSLHIRNGSSKEIPGQLKNWFFKTCLKINKIKQVLLKIDSCRWGNWTREGESMEKSGICKDRTSFISSSRWWWQSHLSCLFTLPCLPSISHDVSKWQLSHSGQTWKQGIRQGGKYE